MSGLYIIELADDESVENVYDATIIDIYRYIISNGSNDYELSVDNVSEMIRDNGIMYWLVKNVQYLAIDINHEYERYENEIRLKVLKFIRNKKITQLGI